MLAIITILTVAVLATSVVIYTSLPFGPTEVTEPPLVFNPKITSTYNDVVGSTATTGVIYTFTVGTSNLGDVAPSPEEVREYFTITDESDSIIAPADITLAYFDGTSYIALTLTSDDSTLTGVFTPQPAFIMPVGYDQEVSFQVTFNTVGTYSGVVTIETAH